MFTRRKREVSVPEVGAEAPEFNLPSAQGGQLRLSMRTVRGPVVVAFYRPGNEDDVGYFKALAAKEQEINMASGSVVGIGVAEPSAAREFAGESGLKSYLLYDYARAASADWGLLERDRRHGDSSRPAVFIVAPDGNVAHAWTGERPAVEELLEKVSAITGLPKKPEEEKPVETEEADGDKPKKMSAEEREKIKADRRAAREAGKSVKSAETSPAAPGTAVGGEQPKKMSKEERDRIKAERRAARESGKSLKTDAPGAPGGATADAPAGAPKKMSAEERERIKAERRAAREAGKSLKTGAPGTTAPAPADEEEKASDGAAAPAPAKMSKEERERIKAERRAAREAGQSLKKPAGEGSSDAGAGDAAPGVTEEKP